MNSYAKMLEAAENVIAEGGEGWWGAEQLGEETNSWVPQVDCEFIEACSPVLIVSLIKEYRKLLHKDLMQRIEELENE